MYASQQDCKLHEGRNHRADPSPSKVNQVGLTTATFKSLPNREGPKPGEIASGRSGGTRGYDGWGYAGMTPPGLLAQRRPKVGHNESGIRILIPLEWDDSPVQPGLSYHLKIWYEFRVQDLVARTYFICGRTSRTGGVVGASVPCRTLSDPIKGQGLMG